MIFTRRAQTILEYTIIVGIVTVVLYYMGTGIKRGFQSMIKVTADQVGNQQNSDQDFNDTAQGYMVASNTATQENNDKQVMELGSGAPGNAMYVQNIVYNQTTDTQTNTVTNGGFTQNN